MSTRLMLIVAGALASIGATAAVPAPVHAVVFVDVVPTDREAGAALLQDYVRRAREEPGVRSMVLIQQADLPNHFLLEETFTEEASYRRFLGLAWVRAFRTALFRHLGSPWDERIGVEPVR